MPGNSDRQANDGTEAVRGEDQYQPPKAPRANVHQPSLASIHDRAARAIKAGRPEAKIAVGSAAGPSFMATGSLSTDPSAQELLLKAFARKDPQGWQTHEQSFRQGFKDGSRCW